MTARNISLILMVLLLATGIFAQTDEEQRRIDEETQRRNEVLAQLTKRSVEIADFVESFLPEGKQSWTVSLTRTGGILGGNVKLIGLVNSNGTVACTGKNHRLSDNAVEDMAEFIRGSNLKTLRKQFEPSPSFCSDCYTTTMEIRYRNLKNKTRAYQYSWQVLPESSPEIKQFYERVEVNAACQ